MAHDNLPAIFRHFHPIEDKMLQIIDNEGNVIDKKRMPELDDEIIIDAYKQMLYERIADEMAVSYQRQGRMYTYTPNIGQEAVHIAAGMHIRGEDWLVPAFREMGTLLAKGVTMKEIFLFYLGNEHGGSFRNIRNVLPMAISIGTQFHHAVGIGYAVKYQKKEEVVFTFIGDGDTSEGDFSEALNFAGVWQVPVIRDGDQLSVFHIAQQIGELVSKARARTLTLQELKEGSFSITSFGSIGGIFATPVINYPQAGILGIGRIMKKPIVKGDVIVIGHIMPLSLTVDHRIVDGGEATRFLTKVMEYLADPVSLIMEEPISSREI